MYTIEKYTEEKEIEWDIFVEKQSINGTFLQSRRFLNYHPKERYKDASLMVYDYNHKLVAVCPANIKNQDDERIFYSHSGSTFGGLVVEKKHYHIRYILPMVMELKEYLVKCQYSEAYIKITSDLLSLVNTDLLQYAFYYCGFSEHKELNLYINYNSYKDSILSNFSQGKRGHINACLKEGIYTKTLCTEDEIVNFYKLLCCTLEKYNLKPIHSIEELIEFKDVRLREECEFYGAYIGTEMVAASMMFYFEKSKCAHAQYLVANPYYNRISTMSYMYYSMIEEMKKKKYNYLSWGIVTEKNGYVINEGLANSKESFGSDYCVNYEYYINLNSLKKDLI